MNLGQIYKNKTDNWSTPNNILDSFLKNGYLDFNPLCIYYKNALLKEHNNYFCNPPFSNIQPFVDYMIMNCSLGFKSVLLLPVRTCTKWFQDLVNFGCDIFFVGRLKYSDKGFAPFDSMVVMLNGVSTRCAWSKQFKEFPIKKYLQLSIFDV